MSIFDDDEDFDADDARALVEEAASNADISKFIALIKEAATRGYTRVTIPQTLAVSPAQIVLLRARWFTVEDNTISWSEEPQE